MRFLAAAAAVLVGLGAGCMGDDSTDKASYVEEADMICSDSQLQMSRVQQPQDPRDPLQLALFLERAVPVAREQNRKLKALERPEEQRTQINRWLGALDAEVDVAERMLTAAQREDRRAVQAALQESALASAQSRQFAQQVGLRVCSGTAS
jgi:hypothetical protein